MAWNTRPRSVSFLAALTFVACIDAATIDFESPVVTAPEGYEHVDPLVLAGVSFEVSPTGPVLFREEPVSGCQETVNQRLGGLLGYFGYGQIITIRANFPSDSPDPVHSVSVDVGSNAFGSTLTLQLDLYGADDTMLAQSQLMPPAGSCWLKTRATLVASSTSVVAYAVVSAYYYGIWDCVGKEAWCAYESVWIDDLTFGPATVTVEPASWGALKVRFE